MLNIYSKTFAFKWSISFLPLLISQVIFAQEPQNSIESCRLITNTIERFNCYDNVEQTQQAPTNTLSVEANPLPIDASVTVPEATPQTPITSNAPEEQFGLPKEPEKNDEIEELFSKITDLRQIRTSRWAITLENGQVWHQVITKRYNLSKGMNVRIYPTPFGSDFRLSSTSVSGFIQVRRVK